MNAVRVSGVRRIVSPILQAEAYPQHHTRHVLETEQHRLWIDIAVCNDLIVVRLFLVGEHIPRSDDVPKAQVVVRCQPLFHVLDIFKHNHGASVPNQVPIQQI